ncbi:MAG: NAD-dependent epimerase/dehydratase family protein [Bradymonadia bacterium]|jgi:UDP-glucose 4-epimerase
MIVAITGINGALARLVAGRLLAGGHEVLGIDRRPWPDAPPGVTMFRADIRKRPAEEVFRTRPIDALIHMATVTHFTASRQERYRTNLVGTQALLEHCHTYGVGRFLFVGRHTVYGAAADTPLFRTEAEPPLAVSTFPDLSDLVAADLFAGSALWRWPEIATAVLRVVYTLGPSNRGTLHNFLRGKRVATVLGFDPLYQFMHEHDAAAAIATAALAGLRGVFNVAGPQPVPLSLLCHATGRKVFPVLEPLYGVVSGRFGFSSLPDGAINHLKYPIVVDATAFQRATGFKADFDEVRTMDAVRLSA